MSYDCRESEDDFGSSKFKESSVTAPKPKPPGYFADTPEPCSFCKALTLWRWLPAPDLRANGMPLCEKCFRAALDGFAKSQEKGFQRAQD